MNSIQAPAPGVKSRRARPPERPDDLCAPASPRPELARLAGLAADALGRRAAARRRSEDAFDAGDCPAYQAARLDMDAAADEVRGAVRLYRLLDAKAAGVSA